MGAYGTRRRHALGSPRASISRGWGAAARAPAADLVQHRCPGAGVLERPRDAEPRRELIRPVVPGDAEGRRAGERHAVPAPCLDADLVHRVGWDPTYRVREVEAEAQAAGRDPDLAVPPRQQAPPTVPPPSRTVHARSDVVAACGAERQGHGTSLAETRILARLPREGTR